MSNQIEAILNFLGLKVNSDVKNSCTTDTCIKDKKGFVNYTSKKTYSSAEEHYAINSK